MYLKNKKVPRVLIIHLKRFDNYAKKMKHFVDFEEVMNLKHLNPKGEDVYYQLCSVLIHEGSFINSGHYYSYVKISGSWYKFNDSKVQKIDEKRVFASSPYVLFYEKIIKNNVSNDKDNGNINNIANVDKTNRVSVRKKSLI